MSNSRTPPAPRPKRRTGLAWHEFNSLPATPAPVVESQAALPPSADVAAEQVPLPGAPFGRRGGSAKGKVLLSLSAAVLVGVLVGVVLFFVVGKVRRNMAPTNAVVPPVDPSSPTEPPVAAPPTVDPLPPEGAPLSSRHIQISVQPTHATLSLDDDVAPAGVISLDVPPDRSPHVVRATAPGYLPYKRTITFASDVLLEIRLKRASPAELSDEPAPTFPRGTGAPAASGRGDGLAEPRAAARPDNKPAPIITPIEDFGMDLQRPTPRRPTKRIDETDPYAP